MEASGSAFFSMFEWGDSSPALDCTELSVLAYAASPEMCPIVCGLGIFPGRKAVGVWFSPKRNRRVCAA